MAESSATTMHGPRGDHDVPDGSKRDFLKLITGAGAAIGTAAMIWPLLCGMAKAKLYLLTSDPLDGAEAERIGLVSRAVPAYHVLDTAMDYARRLARGPQFAVRFTKKALNQWLRLGGITAFDYSQALEMINFFGPELREAVERHQAETAMNLPPA